MAAGRRAAAAPGRRVFAEVRRRLDDGWPAGLAVLTGDDLYHLDRAQRAIVAALGGDDPSGYGTTTFGDERVDVGVVVAAARSAGMFSDRRLVVVTDVAALEGDAEPLETYAAAPPARSHVIVRAPALDQRRTLHKVLARAGLLLRFGAPTDAHVLAADARALAAERDLELAPAAAAFLVELTGADYHRLAGELDKIRAWLGARGGKVEAQTVRDVAAGSGLMSGWEIADAVLRRDRGAALAAARRLVDSGEPPIRMIGGLAFRARVMLAARAMLDAGAAPKAVIEATRAWPYRDQLLAGVRRYTLAELLAFPSLLLRADRTLKSRSIRPTAVLEDLVDRLTATAGGTVAAERR